MQITLIEGQPLMRHETVMHWPYRIIEGNLAGPILSTTVNVINREERVKQFAEDNLNFEQSWFVFKGADGVELRLPIVAMRKLPENDQGLILWMRNITAQPVEPI